MSNYIDENPNMIVFIDDIDKLTKMDNIIKNKFKNMITLTSSTSYGLELIPYGNSKKNSLELLCNKLKIKNSEVISFGNGLNDLEMLQWSRIGIAVKNSNPDLLKKYKLVSEYTNNEDAIYNTLKDYKII